MVLRRITTVRSRPLVAPFADALLGDDLPSLDPARRAETIEFITRRVDGLPSFTRFGVVVIASLYRVLMALPGGWRLARFLAGRPLPLLAEYPRLVRSLGYAFIWEHWPATRPDGAAA